MGEILKEKARKYMHVEKPDPERMRAIKKNVALGPGVYQVEQAQDKSAQMRRSVR